VNQYGSASSFSTYQNSVSDAGLAAAVAAAQQQYSYTGAAAPGFGQQPVMGGSGSSGYGPSQSQAAAAYAASTGLHGAGNKSYNSASLAMADKQPAAAAAAATYSAGSLSSQAYNDANNSYQFGSDKCLVDLVISYRVDSFKTVDTQVSHTINLWQLVMNQPVVLQVTEVRLINQICTSVKFGKARHLPAITSLHQTRRLQQLDISVA